MKFKTHQEIDNFYRDRGVDVDALNREMKAVGIEMDKSRADAKSFLKKKMGAFRYFLWNNFVGKLDVTLGRDIYEDKAKDLGWKNTFVYPKEFN